MKQEQSKLVDNCFLPEDPPRAASRLLIGSELHSLPVIGCAQTVLGVATPPTGSDFRLCVKLQTKFPSSLRGAVKKTRSTHITEVNCRSVLPALHASCKRYSSACLFKTRDSLRRTLVSRGVVLATPLIMMPAVKRLRS